MPRMSLPAAAVLLAAATWSVSTARAQQHVPPPAGAVQHAVGAMPAVVMPGTPPAIQQVAWMGDGRHRAYWHPNQHMIHHGNYAGSGYPYLGASLYPCPEPHVPYQTGWTLVTNQALAPHEMLYPHEYKALYPPFYYQVKGRWFVTPTGVWSREHWKLQGTQVEVEYKSHYSLFSLFVPPRID